MGKLKVGKLWNIGPWQASYLWKKKILTVLLSLLYIPIYFLSKLTQCIWTF